ncbi:MAG: DsbA family protein [Hyphomicrobiales bacterium]|jgi:protein-disulfide isomerase|nr:DsbA family protein [Hyphomicrobiales bacterium]NBS01518.1 DsbA family protein [Hyphomicrobiales bacterium]
MISRRDLSKSALAYSLIGLSPLVLGSEAKAEPKFSAEALAVAGPLGDVVMGKDDAKVTIYEYASLTCSHCAAFHADVLPKLKAKYIETGKIRFILREFPLDPLAVAGFMLSRCNGNERFYPITDLLFSTQKTWAYADKPAEALQSLMRQAGFTQESFEACLKNQSIYDAVIAVRARGGKDFQIDATPTFFINGQMYRGAMTIEELDKAIVALL